MIRLRHTDEWVGFLVIVAVFLFGLSLAPASSLDKTAPHEAIPEGVPAE